MNAETLGGDGEVPMEVSCAEVHTWRETGEAFLFLDCREAEEYEMVCIEGTQLIPMSELQQRVEELHPHREKTIVVHCHLGCRSLQVATWLRQQGFAKAASMAGGIDQWATEIDPSLPKY